jgi:hypothetical protein
MADLTGMMQAAAGSAGGGLLVQDVFSVDLYTGNGATQTITNDLDLSGEGGLVWIKMRATAGYEHILTDTARGAQLYLSSDNTLVQQTGTNDLTAFTSTGFSLGTSSRVNRSVASENTFASWTFRKAPKFFDVVTYTGNGVAGREIAHNLGSVPGCIIVKGISIAEGWAVYHTSQGNTKYGLLDQTDAFGTSSGFWNNTTPTSTVFTVGTNSKVNESGQTYVAYLFAHDDGGFGSGSANVITCGSFTTDGSGSASVTLGYEPQWILGKRTDGAGSWFIFDTTRTWAPTNTRYLQPNNSNAEGNYGATDVGSPNATGFTMENFGSSQTYIYIAIRANM